jgi:predicted HTH domain antitoxin
MTLTVDYPPHLPDAMQLSREEFEREARLALAAKFFESGRLSSGMAARLAGLERVEFLSQLSRFQVSMINVDPKELADDLENA